MTALTPGSASALSKLIDLMRAWGWGLRRTLAHSMPGCEKSAPNAARPVTLSSPSGLMVRLPIHLLSEPFAVIAACFPFKPILGAAPSYREAAGRQPGSRKEGEGRGKTRLLPRRDTKFRHG